MPLYCELPIWGSFFEPINTLTNLAFIIAAYFVWRLMEEAGRAGEAELRQQLRILVWLLIAIGVGSTLWHFFRTPLALALDVIPIQLFLVAFAWFLVGQLFTSATLRVVVVGAFVLNSLATPWLLATLVPGTNLSGYFASLVFAVVLSVVVLTKNVRQGLFFIGTLGLFAISLGLRQLDLTLCDQSGDLGLHFLWHTLNAIVLYCFAYTLLIKLEKTEERE